jgi:hypothetical protein
MTALLDASKTKYVPYVCKPNQARSGCNHARYTRRCKHHFFHDLVMHGSTASGEMAGGGGIKASANMWNLLSNP